MDLVIQTLILIPTLIALPFAPFSPGIFILYLLGLLFLGGWQLISALSYFLCKWDQFRGWYFLSSLTYLGMLAAGTYILEELPLGSHLPYILGITFYGIIPGIAGIWYYNFTLQGDDLYESPPKASLV